MKIATAKEIITDMKTRKKSPKCKTAKRKFMDEEISIEMKMFSDIFNVWTA